MPARDTYHHAARNALLKDGWTITHDPFRLSWGGKDMYVDLGAERLLGAEKGEERIAVEVKSFLGTSAINDLEKAVGQYILYRAVLTEREPNRTLFLAVPQEVVTEVFQEPLGALLLKNQLVRLMGFDPQEEVIVQWIFFKMYRESIERVLTEYAVIPYAYGEIQSETVFDRARDRYLLVNVGWDLGRRVHGALIHVDIIEGKLWIQRDGTEEGVADEFVRLGIPKEKIVLAFRSPSMRPHTGFAVA